MEAKYYCPECGSQNMYHIYNQDVNDPKVMTDDLEFIDSFCTDCELNAIPITLKDMWNNFNLIDTNENGEIDEAFQQWEEGTAQSDIIKWFEEECPRNMEDDLINPIPEEEKPKTLNNRIEECMAQGPLAGVYISWCIQLASKYAKEDMSDDELITAFCGMISPANIKSSLSTLSEIMTKDLVK